MTDKAADIQYWANALKENEEKIRPYSSKMTNKPNSLTYEELYMLNDLLRRNRSLIDLLNETVARPEPTPEPIWKKLIRR